MKYKLVMDIKDYKYDKIEHIISPTCPICMEPINENMTLTSCNHMFHDECINNHLTHNINDQKSKITCPYNDNGYQCKTVFSYKDVEQIVKDNSILKKFKFSMIKNDDNCRVCPKCELSFCTKTNGSWVTKCTKCFKTTCFNCDKNHKSNISCFDANEELKAELDTFYKNSSAILKICPHCGIPQEKLNGCNDVKCGNDADNNLKNIQGCGRKFYWNIAEEYNLAKSKNTFINVHDIETNTKQIYTSLQSINEIREREMEERIIRMFTNQTHQKHNKICLMIFVLISTISIFIIIILALSNAQQKIIIKTQNEQSFYCDMTFIDVDKDLNLNTTCLTNLNMTVENYDMTYCNFDFCPSPCCNNKNKYYEMCIDNNSLKNDEICDNYNEFFERQPNKKLSKLCDIERFETFYICKHADSYDVIDGFLWTFIIITFYLCLFLCSTFCALCCKFM